MLRWQYVNPDGEKLYFTDLSSVAAHLNISVSRLYAMKHKGYYKDVLSRLKKPIAPPKSDAPPPPDPDTIASIKEEVIDHFQKEVSDQFDRARICSSMKIEIWQKIGAINALLEQISSDVKEYCALLESKTE